MLSLPSLLFGAALRLLDFGRWTVLVAPWISPVFLIHFTRSNQPLAAGLAVWLAISAAALLAYRGVIPVPGPAYPITILFFGLTWTVPFIADRLIGAQIEGFATTLVFPLAWVVVETITARASPFGTWGSIAYTQIANPALRQLAAVTGLAGITFVVTWFGSTVNWAWDLDFAWEEIQSGVLIYGLVWVGLMLAGGLRLALRRESPTVPVAAIGWPSGIVTKAQVMAFFTAQPLGSSEIQEANRAFQKLQDYYLEASRVQARAGAKIVIWPEVSLMVFEDKAAAFLQRAGELARQERIYILMGMQVITPGEIKPNRNAAVLIDPEGAQIFDYVKSRPVPGPEAMYQQKGVGPLPVAPTRYGNLAATICYDMDFPDFVLQAGRAGTDILLVPASDVGPIKNLHSAMAVFRAVENGAAMVRATRWGVSTAVDALGRTLAWMDDFTTRENIMLAHVPTTGARTLYPRTGDLFAWLCLAGLLGMIMWGWLG